jgi:hypothetical protein
MTIEPKRHTRLLEGSLKNLFFPPEEGEYKYFERAAASPFIKGDAVVKAAWAADAAMLSYARYGSRRMEDAELERNLADGGWHLEAKIGADPANWNAPGTQAYFATASDWAILAFRGTEADDQADTQTDLDLFLAPEPDYRASASPPWGHLSFIEHLFSAPCLVHRGFQRALNQVWDTIRQLVTGYRQKNPEAEICLTGHSLGGALALLAYSRLADRKVSAYTFGCPRTGNTAFRDRIAASPGLGHFRFVNYNDLVTHVPLESALYRHAPQGCYRFDQSGRLDTESDGTFEGDLAVVWQTMAGLPADFRTNAANLDQLPAPPGLVDHSAARYSMRLWDCV